MEYRIKSLDPLGHAIQDALRIDKARGGRLRYRGSRGGGFEFNGYCAVASAAYFFLAGEILTRGDLRAPVTDVDWGAAGLAAHSAGLQPMQLTWISDNGSERSHWWLAYPSAGVVIDLVVGPDDDPGPDYLYGHGHKCGFMMHGYKRPDKTRTIPLIEMVKRDRRPRIDQAA